MAAGVVAEKYPAEIHIRMALRIVVMVEKQRLTSEYGSSVSTMVMS